MKRVVSAEWCAQGLGCRAAVEPTVNEVLSRVNCDEQFQTNFEHFAYIQVLQQSLFYCHTHCHSQLCPLPCHFLSLESQAEISVRLKQYLFTELN